MTEVSPRTSWAGQFEVGPIATRMVFGPGSRSRVLPELDRAGIDRPLVLTTPRGRDVVERAMPDLLDRAAGTFDRARMHVPRETVEEAVAMAAAGGVQGCVAVGGGSTVGLAKALALELELPYVAVPTTYAGSEMTSIWGVTEDGRKRTGRDERVRPRTAIYDAELTTSLPVDTAVVSGLNALAHAAEAMYAPDRSPFVETLAVRAAVDITRSLTILLERPGDLDAHAGALYAAAMCGLCLGSTAMSLHHKVCHVLGGTFGLPHAQTHATVLPHVLAFNLPAAVGADRALQVAWQDPHPELVVWRLGTSTATAGSLADLGLSETDIVDATDLVLDELGDPQANPRTIGRDELIALLRAAWRGDRPVRRHPAGHVSAQEE